MDEGFVIDEYELSEAINRIIQTIDTLDEAIDSCAKELSNAIKIGITDSVISVEISELEQKISGNKPTLTELKETIENLKIELLNDVETNDNFVFPISAIDGWFSLKRWPY